MIWTKLLLGISLAAPIGPVTIEMIRRGLRRGFWSAFSVRIGGAVGNTLCLIAAFYGLSALQEQELLMHFLGRGGAWCLIWIGLITTLKFFSEINLVSSEPANEKSGLSVGFVVSIFNPVGVAFWFGSFAHSLQEDTSGKTGALFENLMIIAGVLLWGAGLSFILHFGRRFLTPLLVRLITGIAGVALVGYGMSYSEKPILDFTVLALLLGAYRLQFADKN